MISKKKSLVINVVFLIAALGLVVALLIKSISLNLYIIIAWSMVLIIIGLWVLDIIYQHKKSII